MIDKLLFNKHLKNIFAIFFWIGVWQIAFWLLKRPEIIPAPFSSFCKLLEIVLSMNFFAIICTSTLRVFTAFFMGMILGILFAIFDIKIKLFSLIFKPLFVVMKIVPVPAFILILTALVNSSLIPIVISFLMVFPLAFSNISEGIYNIDKKMLEVAYIFNFSKKDTLKYIYWPQIKPYFFTTCKTGIGYSFKATISAEIMAKVSLSIGNNVVLSKQSFDIEGLFAWVIIMVLIGFILEKVVIKILDV